ncbi:hypothetical protein Cgig2_004616 [Carnegiea gigantea]|uniref:Uncharacterized protein n=1 Tax=Carnegiea gigantea TaxID=171969 RepID=A0A9Q1JZB9_9CARY|nr:hypothetical protein Cgig2_004616 [Carnegiea gigantea]
MECWNPEMKAFKVGSREIPFSVYDVALLTGLPMTENVTFDRGAGASEVEDVIKPAMDDHLSRERSRQRTGRSDVRLYRNYVSVIVELCNQNNTPERLNLFRKLYSLVMSGLLFPRTTDSVAWELIGMTEDVEGMGEYNWLAAMWSFLEEAIEDTKQKIRVKKNLQMADFAMMLQAWFYEHTNLCAHIDEKCMPRITSWMSLYIGHKYNAIVLISSVKDN